MGGGGVGRRGGEMGRAGYRRYSGVGSPSSAIYGSHFTGVPGREVFTVAERHETWSNGAVS